MSIDVVAAVIVRSGRIFMQQRPPSKDFAWRWESPGGKVEPGESHREALCREILEEIGVGVALLSGQEPIWSGRFDNIVDRPDRAVVTVHFYLVVHLLSCEPRALDGQPGMGWFVADEMRHLELAPANKRAVDVIAGLVIL